MEEFGDLVRYVKTIVKDKEAQAALLKSMMRKWSRRELENCEGARKELEQKGGLPTSADGWREQDLEKEILYSLWISFAPDHDYYMALKGNIDTHLFLVENPQFHDYPNVKKEQGPVQQTVPEEKEE